jgi:putative endonuclease
MACKRPSVRIRYPPQFLFSMYHTYIIYSKTLDKFYIGSCENLEKRLNDHNTGRSTFTKTGKPWILIWTKAFSSRSEAQTEEYRIKAKKSRKYIEYLISIED